MLFRGDVSLARVYTGARSLRREVAKPAESMETFNYNSLTN